MNFSRWETIEHSPGTHSDGTKVVHATGVTLPGGNHELFILQRNAAGEWKIARYAFSVAHPDN